MTLQEAVVARHSVRQYQEKPIEAEIIKRLNEEIALCNQEGGLHIQLVTDEPKAFAGGMAKYGKFSGVSNYFAMIGKRGDNLDETVGYYGEKLVLEAQMMGLNTCWVALSYKKIASVMSINDDEKLVCLISLGYGATQGVDHKRKSPDKVSLSDVKTAPQWYKQGVACALLAPTAINQQKFKFAITSSGTVRAKAGLGPYAKIDLGIVKYHFEIGAGINNFTWE